MTRLQNLLKGKSRRLDEIFLFCDCHEARAGILSLLETSGDDGGLRPSISYCTGARVLRMHSGKARPNKYSHFVTMSREQKTDIPIKKLNNGFLPAHSPQNSRREPEYATGNDFCPAIRIGTDLKVSQTKLTREGHRTAMLRQGHTLSLNGGHNASAKNETRKDRQREAHNSGNATHSKRKQTREE